MAPRITLLIALGIVVYVSLSLYHWRQVKKIPGAENRNGVHSVLTRERQEKNWIQVSTSPSQSGESEKNTPPIIPTVEIQQTNGQVTTLSKDLHAEISLLIGNETVDPPHAAQQAVRDQKNEQRNAQPNEEEINQLQEQKTKELQAQAISLESSVAVISPQLEEKNNELKKLNKQSYTLTAKSDKTAPSTNNQIKILKTSLASKLDALVKANARISALADRLEQNKRTLLEAETTNEHLRRILAQTENEKITASQKADRLGDELIGAKEDKEKYLAETGRLHKQLQQTRTRLVRIESELNKSHLKAESMLRYGQEQTDLVTPFLQQIKILNARVEDKKRDLIKAEEQMELLQNQDQLIQDKIQNLMLDLEKNEVISQELQEKSQALDDAQKHSDELTLQLKVLADQLNAKDVMISKLRQDAAQHTDNLKKKTERQQQELASANQTLVEMQQQLDLVTARQKETETTLDDVKSEKKQLSMKIEEQHKLQATAKSESEQIIAQLNKKDKQLAEANKALLSSKATLKQLETAKQTVTVVEKNNAAANETIKQLQSALKTSQSHLKETAVEIKNLKNSLAEAERRQKNDTTATKLQEKIDQLKKTIADNKKQQETIKQSLSDMEQKNKQLKEKISASDQEMSSATALAAALEIKTNELSAEKNRIDALNNKVADLQSNLDRRENAFFTMQEEFTSLQDKHESLQKERDTLFLYTLDNDSDTISDAKDECPNTFFGAEVGHDGCERDQDGDNVVDRLDLCPAASEQNDINPFGCAKGAPIVLPGIYFSGGNTELSPASRSSLDKVASILDLFKDIHFEVGGHTDNIGETDRNLTVSKKRAEAVSNYLIENGIDASRLVPVGYGPDKPVADNTTTEGRAANRRVELIILSPNTSPAALEEEESITTTDNSSPEMLNEISTPDL